MRLEQRLNRLERRAGIETTACSIQIENGPGAYDEFRAGSPEFRNHFIRSRDRHGHFDDANSAPEHCVRGKQSIFRRRRTNGGDDADLLDPRPNFFLCHRVKCTP